MTTWYDWYIFKHFKICILCHGTETCYLQKLAFLIVGESGDNSMEEYSDNEVYNSQDEKRIGTKKRRYSQKYNKEFESDPLLKGWIKQSSKGDGYAYCSACAVHLKLTAGRTDLK